MIGTIENMRMSDAATTGSKLMKRIRRSMLHLGIWIDKLDINGFGKINLTSILG